MPIVMLSLIVTYILVAASGNIDLSELQPILSKGMKPVLEVAYPNYVAFPYGEDVVFLMYYCYSNSEKDIRKYAIIAIAIIGTFLTISTAIIISVIGAGYASVSTIPLLDVIKMISVGDILTNLDAIGILIMFIGGLFKSMLFFYGSVITISTLFKINLPNTFPTS